MAAVVEVEVVKRKLPQPLKKHQLLKPKQALLKPKQVLLTSSQLKPSQKLSLKVVNLWQSRRQLQRNTIRLL